MKQPFLARLATATLRSGALPILLAVPFATPAVAQRGNTEVISVRRLGSPQGNLPPAGLGQGSLRQAQLNAGTALPAIMLTGYWPSTNEMVRQFSIDPIQNPGGWQGANWEGRGYDIFSYFPEFTPPNCVNCGQGMGDLEVDYQDTTQDFWAFANALKPIAILTTSRGGNNIKWEVEMNQINRTNWINDFTAPFQPTPSPPDATYPADAIRLSTLPVQAIVDAVIASGLPLAPEICFAGNGGGFLSEFIAYNGVWYQDIHKNPEDPDWCIAAGHIHVGSQVSWPTAITATEVTLRVLTDHVDNVLGCANVTRYCVAAPNSVGPGASIGWYGNTEVLSNNFHLTASGAPPLNFGIFLYGQNQVQLPAGNGFLCTTGNSVRLMPVLAIGGLGAAERQVDFTQPPANAGPNAITPGSFWNFQFWYRDPAAPAPGFNFTDALNVGFCI